MGATDGRYAVVKRGGKWIARAPDGKAVQTFGSTDENRRSAQQWVDRANEKLRAIDDK